MNTCQQLVQLSSTEHSSLNDLDHCYSHCNVLIAYRTVGALTDLTAHKHLGTTVLSTTVSAEHLLRLILNRSAVPSTLFYMEGEPDPERVISWLTLIDQRFPAEQRAVVYYGLGRLSFIVEPFIFKRLKSQVLRQGWLQLG
jgi:hypothetical protein